MYEMLYKGGVVPSRAWCLPESLFGCATVWLGGSSLDVVSSPPLVVLVLGLLGQGSGAGQCQTFSVTGLALPVRRYHSVHCLWLHLLDLVVHGSGQSVYMGLLPPA